MRSLSDFLLWDDVGLVPKIVHGSLGWKHDRKAAPADVHFDFVFAFG